MRIICIIALILSLLSAEDTELSSSAYKALENYSSSIDKAKEKYEAELRSASEALAKVLNKEMETLAKKGNEKTAQLLQEKINALGGDDPEGKALLEAFKQKPNYTKKWCIGNDWEVIWNGYRNIVTFQADGSCKRGDGFKGTFQLDKEDVAHISWDNGEGWSMQPPHKSTPDQTLGLNHTNSTFRVNRLR